MVDVLLTHAYFLATDPHEAEIMRPFPPLGLQYLVAFLRQERVCEVDWFDATFHSGPHDVIAEIDAQQPKVVGLYGHTITRPVARGIVRGVQGAGHRRDRGGPDPVQYLDEYFDMGVDVSSSAKASTRLAESCARSRERVARSRRDLGAVDGIAFRATAHDRRTRRPRALIKPIDQLPWPSASGAISTPTSASGASATARPRSAWCRAAAVRSTARGASKQVYGDTYRRRSSTT